MLSKNQYSITYYVDNNDEYLKTLNIENPNSSVYSKQDGLVLQDLIVDGYNFNGWYTAQTGGDLVTEISPGETGNKRLYAHWEKVQYIITFDSTLCTRDSIKRTIDEKISIYDLDMPQYKFMGWTDDTGNVITTIEPGIKKYYIACELDQLQKSTC